jgi:hypothetical protein
VYRRPGQPVLVFERWRRRRQGDESAPPHGLDRPGDPRGGVQSDDYRHADPRDVVEEGGTAMGGPGGAPQEGSSPDERREQQRG